VGFLLFFILEHFAIKSKHKTGSNKEKSDENISNYSFGVHFAIIAFLNLILGYALRFEAEAGLFSAFTLYNCFIITLHYFG
jgi:hypothetical protein